MDSIIERLGLYEFFTDLLVGLITLAGLICFGPMEWLSRFIADANLHYINKMLTNNEFIVSCIFIIAGYFLGMIVHEAASLPEKLLLKIREHLPHFIEKWFLLRFYSRCNYVTDVKLITTGHERERCYDEIFSGINVTGLSKEKSEKMQEDYFLKALTYLEANGKGGKIHRIDGLFGMSRSLAHLLIAFSVYFVFNRMYILSVAALISGVLFYTKSYWYINYRTREILRQYHHLHDSEKPL